MYKHHGTGYLDYEYDPKNRVFKTCDICGGKPGKDRGKHETTKMHKRFLKMTPAERKEALT